MSTTSPPRPLTLAPIHLRPATQSDAPAIASLGSRVFTLTFGHSLPAQDLQTYLSESYSPSAINKDILDPAKSMTVATATTTANIQCQTDDRKEREIVGFALLTRNSHEPCVEHLASRAELQRLCQRVVTLRSYIFLGPYQTEQPAPYIYDNQGNLVWSGYGAVGAGGQYHGLHVCSYNSSDHLCVFTGFQFEGFSRGTGLILDNAYRVVENVVAQAGNVPNDQHEFSLTRDGNTALITIYRPIQHDLSDYGISGGQGWIMNCAFQEVEIGTNRVIFQWNSLDHVDPSYGYVLPNASEVSGTGFSPSSAWDYFHINSVAKFTNGDYLISARHTSTIYRISPKDGSVVWSLGGKSSSFSLEPGFNFTFQHDARVLLENKTTVMLSLFDNASNGYNQSAPTSAGMIARLDLTRKSATLMNRYPAPETAKISASQGNLQLLPNGNAFLGWGSSAYISEYTREGENVLEGHFATTGSMHYRAFKANFSANPTDAPAAYVYAPNDTQQASTTWYVSWNGATEVRSWQIYTASESGGKVTKLSNTSIPKVGFETIHSAKGFFPFSVIEALDGNGKAIRNTTTQRTFVPGQALGSACSDSGCAVATSYAFTPQELPLKAESGSATVMGDSGAASTTSDTPTRTTSANAGSSLSICRYLIWSFIGMGMITMS
ncbi:MAG: hypothetical protein Q9227_008625 [Pyrenula ochraceoflavens]